MLKTSAVRAVEESDKGFTELIHFIKMRQCAAMELILAQEEAAVKKAEELLERLGQEIADLKSRDAELRRLERLSQADDDICFLQVSTPASTKACILKHYVWRDEWMDG